MGVLDVPADYYHASAEMPLGQLPFNFLQFKGIR